VPSIVVVRAVEARAGEAALEPTEQRLVANVHPQRYLGLLPIPAKVALSDEDARDEPALDVGERRSRLC
jgi:hypothetical protein